MKKRDRITPETELNELKQKVSELTHSNEKLAKSEEECRTAYLKREEDFAKVQEECKQTIRANEEELKRKFAAQKINFTNLNTTVRQQSEHIFKLENLQQDQKKQLQESSLILNEYKTLKKDKELYHQRMKAYQLEKEAIDKLKRGMKNQETQTEVSEQEEEKG